MMTLKSLSSIALITIFSFFTSFATAGPMSKTASNEAIVLDFYTQIFIDGADVEKTAKQYLTKNYIQHNPWVATGRQGFIDAFSSFTPNPNSRTEIKRVVSDGDLVILHLHAYEIGSESAGSAGIDIFRVNKRGKIAEHWDVWQTISDWMAHDNGMF